MKISITGKGEILDKYLRKTSHKKYVPFCEAGEF